MLGMESPEEDINEGQVRMTWLEKKNLVTFTNFISISIREYQCFKNKIDKIFGS